jgi:hypothetical protein
MSECLTCRTATAAAATLQASSRRGRRLALLRSSRRHRTDSPGQAARGRRQLVQPD